ncbi:unnamed protein product [Caretta caretta]
MAARLSNATVAHELAQGYQGAGDKAEMPMDVGSLLVRGGCQSAMIRTSTVVVEHQRRGTLPFQTLTGDENVGVGDG